jgi:hypothetical protein
MRQGKSLREIAQATGMAVNTVTKHVAADGPPRYGTAVLSWTLAAANTCNILREKSHCL